MSNLQASAKALDLPYVDNLKIAIVAARWNSHITDRLVEGAIDELKRSGYDESNYDVFRVPGTIELTYAATRLVDTDKFDAVIMIGCVIKGETPHFDYVCQSVTEGCTSLNGQGLVPVIFGVVTTLDEAQALERAGGGAGNKGAEAAAAALEMIAFSDRVSADYGFISDFSEFDESVLGDDVERPF